jgi:hypothetical protein
MSETKAPKAAVLTTVPRKRSPDLGQLRVGDRVDHVDTGSLGRRAIGGADVNRAVVLDRDVAPVSPGSG